MKKTNLQIRIPEELDIEIENLAPHSKSEFVRQAIEEKIQKEKELHFEKQWIKALKKNPEDLREAEKWSQVESWEER